MRHALIAAIATAALCLGSADLLARSGSSSHRHSGSSPHSPGHSGSHSGGQAGKSNGPHSGAHANTGKHGGTQKASGVKRDANGEIQRSAKAKDDFKHAHPCSSTGRSSGACPGYVIDHVTPLKRGGADAPSNMQWQTKTAAKAKDKTE